MLRRVLPWSAGVLLLLLPLAAHALIFLAIPLVVGVVKWGAITTIVGGSLGGGVVALHNWGCADDPREDVGMAQALCDFYDGTTNWIQGTIGSFMADAAYASREWSLGLLHDLLADDACFMCVFIAGLVKLIPVLGQAAFSILAFPMLLVAVAGFLFVHTLEIGKHFVSQARMPWRATVISSIWFAFALVLLGGLGATSGSAPTVASELFANALSGLLAPILTGAVSAGLVVFDAVEASFPGLAGSASANPTSAADYVSINQQIDAKLPQQMAYIQGLTGTFTGFQLHLVEALTRLILILHQVAILGLARAVLFMTSFESLTDQPIGMITAMIIGLILFAGFLIFYIVAGLRFADPLMRVLVVVGMGPVLIAGLPFRGLRSGPVMNALRSLGYAAVYLLLVALVYAVVLSTLLQSFSADSARYGPTLPSLEELIERYVSRQAPNKDPGASSSVKVNDYVPILEGDGTSGSSGARPMVDVSSAVILMVCLFFAHTLAGSVSEFAAGLTAYTPGGSIGEQAEQQISSQVTSVAAGAAPAIVAAGAARGAAFAKQTGGAAAKGAQTAASAGKISSGS